MFSCLNFYFFEKKFGFGNNPQASSSSTATSSSSTTATIQKKTTKRIKTPESEQINFAIEVILNTFTEQEIREGIFADQKNQSKSKTRIVFSQNRTNEVKGKFLLNT